MSEHLDENGFVRDAPPDHGAARPAIVDCGLCDDEGYRGMHRCDHEDHASAARRGMDMIREAMGWENP